MVDCVCAMEQDSVVFCHYIAINVVVGAATNVDEMISFRPDNGSVTKFETTNANLQLVELGRDASTKIG